MSTCSAREAAILSSSQSHDTIFLWLQKKTQITFWREKKTREVDITDAFSLPYDSACYSPSVRLHNLHDPHNFTDTETAFEADDREEFEANQFPFGATDRTPTGQSSNYQVDWTQVGHH